MDTFRTDRTIELLQYVMEMLHQDEIELENEIANDVAFFLSKAIENLTYNFEKNRELFQACFEQTFETISRLEAENKDL